MVTERNIKRYEVMEYVQWFNVECILRPFIFYFYFLFSIILWNHWLGFYNHQHQYDKSNFIKIKTKKNPSVFEEDIPRRRPAQMHTKMGNYISDGKSDMCSRVLNSVFGANCIRFATALLHLYTYSLQFNMFP